VACAVSSGTKPSHAIGVHQAPVALHVANPRLGMKCFARDSRVLYIMARNLNDPRMLYVRT
jgi:hypothetical protein